MPWARTGRRLLDLVLPARCLGCGAVVAGDVGLCPDCWRKLDLVADPVCARCGRGLDVDIGDGGLCGPCLDDPPGFDRARAVFRYNDLARQLVLGLKYRDRLDAVPVFARWMARAGESLLAEADVLAPVPLHWRRLLARRYNQAAELARRLGGLRGVRVEPDLLRRTRATPPLGRMSRAERARTVDGAFRVTTRCADVVRGKRVLLIDDVLTTGATAGALADALRAVGAAGVDLLTLARVDPAG